MSAVTITHLLEQLDTVASFLACLSMACDGAMEPEGADALNSVVKVAKLELRQVRNRLAIERAELGGPAA